MRRGLGRGRTLIALGAGLAIAGMPLPWLKVGGVVLSPETANGFDGTGVLVFVAAVLMLALIVLPYTLKSRQAALDRTISYIVLLLVGLAGLAPALLAVIETEGSAIGPTDVPGLWLSTSGMVVAAWGLAELLAERGAAG